MMMAGDDRKRFAFKGGKSSTRINNVKGATPLFIDNQQ
jgi:hypothetical protein